MEPEELALCFYATILVKMIKNRENHTITYKHPIEKFIFNMVALGILASVPLFYWERMNGISIFGWLIISGVFIGGLHWRIYRHLKEQKEMLRNSIKRSMVLSHFSKEYSSNSYYTFPIFKDKNTGLLVKSIIPVVSGLMVKGREYEVFQLNQKCIPIEFSSWKLKEKGKFKTKLSHLIVKEQKSKEFLMFRNVLLKNWDPLGVSKEPERQKEYDPFIPRLMSLSRKGNVREVAEYLEHIETNNLKLEKPEGLHEEFLTSLAQVLVQITENDKD